MNVEWPPLAPETEDETVYKVKPFSVGKFLEQYTIDAITTTIDSAWRLNGASEENQLMFHPETKILLVKCSTGDMDVMEQVLNTLHEAIPEKKPVTMIEVNVLGQVNKPGNYSVPFGSRLTQAIAEAGGEKQTGDTRKISFKTSSGTQKVNLREIINGNEADIKLYGGETIFVPERIF